MADLAPTKDVIATVSSQSNLTSALEPSVNGTVPKPPLQVHYNELLRVISEIGKDVKPAYTSSKISTDKLRKNIMVARTVLRECQADLERLEASAKD